MPLRKKHNVLFWLTPHLGEPIVNTPEDAYRCFMRTDMDYLVLENQLLNKKDQPTFLDKENWQQTFELD